MSDNTSILSIAKRTLETESKAIANLVNLLDEEFAEAVQYILNCHGRVVVSGVGKSAIIASKIVATLNSTGTPAIFMHAADAIHGDLGTVQENDVVVCISKSGNTPEIKALIPLIKLAKNKLIGITGNLNSVLAKQADFTLNTYVDKEACPNNLAPTTSTAAQLAIGDALAICLLELRGFSSSDFAKFHPGGALGKKLYLRVSDIVALNQKPKVNIDSSVKQVIVEISEKMLGVTAVIENEKVVGVVTDGDIRRMLNKYDNINGLTAGDIMTRNPKSVKADTLAVKALEQLQDNGISQLLAFDGEEYAGVVHIHNLINEGIL
ncbi:KpsF/GutQ family sugar-phosphate isomerase [Flagellimonas allohymeniacidonis]|uniref:KpsF/GutQ family sugar-phosphate isomerase n=1 Tax=Flagellimonas allohymeniacidonis TaxID=2517819 RepID=A0A4Q8QFP2_9FLAO|nr:KpsF/GutQ family sugar-phosphate isomerase [Allomuricauda hymeniacidonis]TAI49352.1 KpsF/GutQ family sugar-phosphate isomerase [Allomuricauda hymeniacidonis]